MNIFSLASLGLLIAAMLAAPSAWSEDSDADQRESACLLIEPVICRPSEGKEPAVSRVDRKARESVYALANIQIDGFHPVISTTPRPEIER